MWAVVVVMLAMLSGPQAIVITDAGTFKTEGECQASIAAAIPSKLDAESKAQLEKGERRYVCVRAIEPQKAN